MYRFLTTFLLSGALLLPVAVVADEHHDDHDKRYYDRNAKDYHQWNEREDRVYRMYLEQNRRKYHGWAKANRTEQDQYWKWRHSHSDVELKLDIR